MAALVASALAGGLVAASWLGDAYAIGAGIAVVQLLLVVGLARSTDVPAARTSATLALVAGLGSGAYVILTAEAPVDSDALAPVLVAVGAGFVSMVIVQLARRDGRGRLTASLTFGVTMLLLTAASVSWLVLGSDTVGEGILLIALTGVAVGAAIMIFPGPEPLWVLGGTIGAGSVGLIMQAYLEPVEAADLGPLAAAVVAGACGLAGSVGVWAARLLRDDPGASPQGSRLGLTHALVVSALPVALAGPAAAATTWAFVEGLLT